MKASLFLTLLFKIVQYICFKLSTALESNTILSVNNTIQKS